MALVSWTLGLYSAAGQELTVIPACATLFIAVEPLTTFSTSFKRQSAVIVLLFYVHMLLWQGRMTICQCSEVKKPNKQSKANCPHKICSRQRPAKNTRNKPDNDDNTISMWCIFGAINDNTESIIVQIVKSDNLFHPKPSKPIPFSTTGSTLVIFSC